MSFKSTIKDVKILNQNIYVAQMDMQNRSWVDKISLRNYKTIYRYNL